MFYEMLSTEQQRSDSDSEGESQEKRCVPEPSAIARFVILAFLGITFFVPYILAKLIQNNVSVQTKL